MSKPTQTMGKIFTDDTRKKNFDWFQQTLALLTHLQHVLSATIKAWDVFNSSSGDFEYFADQNGLEDLSDSSQARSQMSLHAIKRHVEILESLQEKLISFQKKCRASAKDVSLPIDLFP